MSNYLTMLEQHQAVVRKTPPVKKPKKPKKVASIDEEFKKRLDFLKNYYGLKASVQVLRMLVSEKYREVERK